jgi:hypothetical protein
MKKLDRSRSEQQVRPSFTVTSQEIAETNFSVYESQYLLRFKKSVQQSRKDIKVDRRQIDLEIQKMDSFNSEDPYQSKELDYFNEEDPYK